MVNIFQKLRPIKRKWTKALKRKNAKYRSNYRKAAPGLIILSILIITLYVVLANSKALVFTVSIDGKEMGQVRDKDVIYEIIDSVEKDLSTQLGTEVTINDKKISFTEAEVDEITPVNEESIIKELSKSQNCFVKAWAIIIEGEETVVLANQDEAQQLLEHVKSHYLKTGSQYLDISFKEKVEVSQTNVSIEALMDYENALRYILTGTTKKEEHQVRSGESLWTIAERYQVGMDVLETANPEIKPDKLQIGQKISLLIPKPYLTVVTVEKAVVSEKIQYGTTYEKTDALYEGEEKVKLEGVYGIKEIQTQVIRENGKEVATEVIDSALVQEPENQTVLLGTKAIPSSLGTGALDNPTRGMITSTFGRRWGRMHSGIDIASDRGTLITAADGGVVSFAGWKGNYGLTVIISHGNNRSTLYSHCDEVLVSEGEVVTKGQNIGKMGDTGNATGVHLHFEVRINNIPQDPMKYVEYTVD